MTAEHNGNVVEWNVPTSGAVPQRTQHQRGTAGEIPYSEGDPDRLLARAERYPSDKNLRYII